MKETGTFTPLIDTTFFRVIVIGQPKQKETLHMSLFDFGVGRSARAKRIIAELNLAPYVAKAVELFGLKSDDIVQAMLEYRHLLYLLYWNKRLEEEKVVVPTKLADKLWHAHILFTRDYFALCDKLGVSYLHHTPGLNVGTKDHGIAMKWTRELHNYVYHERQRPGFDPNYFAELDPKPAPRREPTRTRSRRKDESSADSNSGLAFDPSFQGNNVSVAATADDDRGGSFYGGGNSGGGGASGDWGGGSSSDSGGGSSCGGGGCGGGGD